MPLRCIDEHGSSIHAFDLLPEAWKSLSQRNRRERHLRTPCCASAVALKQSRLGTQFFAHIAKGSCVTASETEVHLRLKQLAVEAARVHGWDAETEVSDMSPSGEIWRADVLARKGEAKVAVEIQWSSQTDYETLRRQERYRASGVRCLWLLRKSGVPVTERLPAAMITAGPNHTYTAALSSGQMLPASALLDAAFSGRLKFGIPIGAAGAVSVRAARTKCWHDSCKAETTILTGLDISFGPYRREVSVADFSGEPELFSGLYSHIPGDLRIGMIKRRHSRTMATNYLSNGCIRCDRLFGRHFELAERDREQIVCTIPIRASGHWRDFFLNSDDMRDGWAVFRSDELPS